jgi:hypothetical protein
MIPGKPLNIDAQKITSEQISFESWKPPGLQLIPQTVCAGFAQLATRVPIGNRVLYVVFTCANNKDMVENCSSNFLIWATASITMYIVQIFHKI